MPTRGETGTWAGGWVGLSAGWVRVCISGRYLPDRVETCRWFRWTSRWTCRQDESWASLPMPKGAAHLLCVCPLCVCQSPCLPRVGLSVCWSMCLSRNFPICSRSWRAPNLPECRVPGATMQLGKVGPQPSPIAWYNAKSCKWGVRRSGPKPCIWGS